MNNLAHNNPQVYQDFMASYHVVRRTEGHSWGSVSPDYITEKTLILSLKSTGGHTRGTRFEKVQRNFRSYLDQHVLKLVHQ